MEAVSGFCVCLKNRKDVNRLHQTCRFRSVFSTCPRGSGFVAARPAVADCIGIGRFKPVGSSGPKVMVCGPYLAPRLG
jgi:hypothetical protein